MNEKPIKTGLETISCPGVMLGYQEGSKNALEETTFGVGAILPDPYTTDEDVFWESESATFESNAQARNLIDNLGNVETHYGHLYHEGLMDLQSSLVRSGRWEMIPNNLGQPDDYWARRVR